MKELPSNDKLIDFSRPLGSRPVGDADYRTMVEAVTDYAIFLLDVNGAIRSWNAGAHKLKQYEPEDVIGRHFSMFYPQELIDRDWPGHELAEAKRTGRFEDEGWRVRKDGTRFWANIIITRLSSPNGELRGFSKITRDLSERRQQEELMRLSEERFRLLVEGVKDYAIFMLDPSGHVMSWNTGAEKNQGYKAAEIIGQHFSVFYPPELAGLDGPQNELDTALREGQFQEEGWRIRKDGSRFWAGVTLTSVYDETGRHRGFAKVTRDLTETRKISALEDEGRRITEFLAMLGHELRNPLAPIANAVSVIHKLGIESAPLAMASGVIERQVKQLTRLVDDLLDVSRITSGKIKLERKPVRLQDVLAQASESVGPLLEAKVHRYTVALEPHDVWVSGDRARLVQVATNLLANAAKFTPARGQINVELRIVGGYSEIRVRDNGPGVPLELQSKIFDLFVQGETDSARSSGGLGLGLSLSRQLVALHGGEIDLFSRGVSGAGSEFIVRLPTMKAPSQRTDRMASDRRKVLIVDDNHDAADTLGMLVEALGYEATVAYDGISGLDAVLAGSPEVVLLDLALPGLSGLEMAARIEFEIRNPPQLIAVSGYGQDSDREATFKAGFVAHITKPVDADQLSDLLKRSLR